MKQKATNNNNKNTLVISPKVGGKVGSVGFIEVCQFPT